MPKAPTERDALGGAHDELAADPADGEIDDGGVAGAACQAGCPSEGVGWAVGEAPAKCAGEEGKAVAVPVVGSGGSGSVIVVRLWLWLLWVITLLWLLRYEFLRGFFWHNHRESGKPR